MKKTRRKFTKEFKAKVVAEYSQPGTKLKDIVAQYKLNPVTIRSWVKNAEKDVTKLTNPKVEGKSLLEAKEYIELHDENVSLKRVIEELKLDLYAFRETLKTILVD